MISMEIRKFVGENARTLYEINTGGGVDYFGKQLATGQTIIVAAEDDAGSPMVTWDPACIYIWLDDDWQEWIRIPFGSATDAYIAAHNMEADSA